MNERDELAAIIFPVIDKLVGYRGGYPGDVDGEIAETVLAAGYGKTKQ